MIKKWILALVYIWAAFIPKGMAGQCSVSAQPYEIFIESNGSKLFCKVMGKGKPLIVIHGGPGLTHEYLLPYFDALAGDHLVIFYDQRGCGQSTGEINPDTINVPNFINDLENIRCAFNFDKISLLGHSWGGFLAMNYAISHPQTVEKLILSNSVPACTEDHAQFFKEYLKRTAPYQEELSKIKATQEFQLGEPKEVEQFYRIMFRPYFYQPEKIELLNLRRTSIACVNGEKIFKVIWENLLRNPYDLHTSLKTLSIPTLVIHGDADPIPLITAQKIHESIQGSKYVVLNQCGHFPYIECTEEYLSLLKEFLSVRENTKASRKTQKNT